MEKTKFDRAKEIQSEIFSIAKIHEYASKIPVTVSVWDRNRGNGIEYPSEWDRLKPHFNREKVQEFLQDAIVKAAELKMKELKTEFENL